MIRKISYWIYRFTGVVISIMLGLIVVLTFAQVISRYVFSFSIDWTQELTIYIMVWMVFLGCSMGMRKHEVATMSFVMEKLPLKIQKAARLLCNICLITFLVICIIVNTEIIEGAMKRISPIMKIKMGYISAAFSVSSAIIAFNCCIDFYDAMKKLIRERKGVETR